MEILKTLMEQLEGWKTILLGGMDQVPSLPFVRTGMEVMAGIFVLLLIAYRFRVHQLRRQRRLTYQISGMISHLCDTYDSLEDVDWKKQKAYRYHFRDGRLEIQERDLDSLSDLIGPLLPEDAAKYPEEVLKGYLEKAMKTCQPVEFTAREKAADGTWHWKSILFQGVKKDAIHTRSCLLLKRDVNDTRGAEMEKRVRLSQDRDQAREAVQAKAEFLNRISQDTREALRDIMGDLTLTDVKELSDIENGILETRSEAFDVDKTLEKMNALFQKEAAKRGISYSCNVEPLLYTHLVGDEKRLEQVLLNLLTNALLFTEKGQRVLCAVRQKLVKNKKVCMEFTVLCAGMKMPQDMVDKVFLPFELTRQVGSAKVHGGLGLVVTHRLVHLLGGLIKADNAEGKGMRFIIELPYDFTNSAK